MCPSTQEGQEVHKQREVIESSARVVERTRAGTGDQRAVMPRFFSSSTTCLTMRAT